MGENVERPDLAQRAERFEITGPDLVGTCADLPDVPTVMVDGALAEEVDRTNHIVEIVALEQGGRLLLGS